MGPKKPSIDNADTDRDEDARGGVAAVMRAFDTLKVATLSDPQLKGGREHLPRTESEGRARAMRIIDLLDQTGSVRPDRLVQTILDDKAVGKRMHVAPVYSVRIGGGPKMEAVIDPFLRSSPVSLEEWKKTLAAQSLVYLFPEVLLGAREEALTAPIVLEKVSAEITTQRRGQGKAEDCHGLALLLRAWLKQPDDRSQVARFREMFGELTWRAFQQSYPELLNEIEHELARDGSRV